MVCVHPFYKGGIPLPCGHCMPCKIMRSHQWAMRLMFELRDWSSAAFVTLTYRDADLPPNLRKRHVQLFFKRLRKSLGKRKIKYYAVGEYGDVTHRPHYHAIIYGLDSDNLEDRILVKNAWIYADWACLPSKAIGSVTYDSCRYVAGYVQKKLYGKSGKAYYQENGLTPPFSLCSRGLGLGFAIENADFLKDSGLVRIDKHVMALPRYYREKIHVDKERLNELMRDKEQEDFLRFARIFSSKFGSEFSLSDQNDYDMAYMYYLSERKKNAQLREQTVNSRVSLYNKHSEV